MKQVISGGVRVSYPEQAWACNPITLDCTVLKQTVREPGTWTPQWGYAINTDTGQPVGVSVSGMFTYLFIIPAGCDRVFLPVVVNYFGEKYGTSFRSNGSQVGKIHITSDSGLVDGDYIDVAIPEDALEMWFTGIASTPGNINSVQPIVFYSSTAVADTSANTQIAVEVEGRRAYRDTFKGQVSFDIQGLARLMFTPEEFYKMPTGQDFELYKDMTFKLFRVEEGQESMLFEDTIQCIFGALQPGEIYKLPTRIPYWPGYPFSIPFVITDTYTMLKREDQGTYNYSTAEVLSPGKYNIPISAQADRIVIRLNLSNEVQPTIYETTFDHTFQGMGESTKFIEILRGCEQPGSEHIYLRWINVFGGWSFGLFKVLSKSTTSQDSSAKIERNWRTTEFIDNYHGGVDLALTKDSQEVYNVGIAGLDQVEFDWIAECVKSFWVDQYMGDGNWRKVSIANATITKQAKNIQELTFSVNMPKYQNQSL